MNSAIRLMMTLWVPVVSLLVLVPAQAQCPSETAKLIASDGEAWEGFGRSVSISGNLTLCTILYDFNEMAGVASGSVGVFVRDPQTGMWKEEQELTASDASWYDYFGSSASISGNAAIVGARNAGSTSTPHTPQYDGCGAAYIFYRSAAPEGDGSLWSEEQILLASDGERRDRFGWSVSIDGNVAVVGSPLDDTGELFDTGSASVYRYNPDTESWDEETKLIPSDANHNWSAGADVALSGDLIVVNAPGDDHICPGDPACNAGSVYVFRYNPASGSWDEKQKLISSDIQRGDLFGISVSVFDDVVLVGATGDSDDTLSQHGSAYVFRYDPAAETWIEEDKLTASDITGLVRFGNDVAIGNGVAIVGNAEHHGPEGTYAGAAYVFRHDPVSGVWTEQAIITSSDIAGWDYFGLSVALSDGKAVIGAPDDDDNGDLSGSAYVFELDPGDVDGDLFVNGLDIQGFVDCILMPGEPAGPCTCADFDFDRDVDLSDLEAMVDLLLAP